jgi:hypothetical protein
MLDSSEVCARLKLTPRQLGYRVKKASLVFSKRYRRFTERDVSRIVAAGKKLKPAGRPKKVAARAARIVRGLGKRKAARRG